MRRFCIVLGCIAVIWVWLFYFNVSAMTKEEYEQQYFSLLSEYQHGYITFDEFQQREDELTARYTESNTDENGVINSVAQNVSNTVNKVTDGIGNAVGTVGETVKDWIDDVLNPYETTDSVPDVDMQGYGALVKRVNKSTGVASDVIYCGYVLLKDPRTAYIRGDGFYYSYNSSGALSSEKQIYDNGTNTSSGLSGKTFAENSTYRLELYGDIRLEDGTSAGDDVTNNDDINYTDINKYDFSNATDRELDELLKNLNEMLEREQPDLSSVEGLLESIYYRLGKLDSDNDNALLSQVIVAIENLRTDDSDLLFLLEEIRDKLSNDKTIDNTDYQEKILEYISPSDVSAYEEFSINVKGLFYSKFSFISEFQSFFSSLSWSSPESIVIDFSFMDNNYSIDTSVYNELMPTVRGMLAFFIYGVFCIRCFRRMPAIISGGGDE